MLNVQLLCLLTLFSDFRNNIDQHTISKETFTKWRRKLKGFRKGRNIEVKSAERVVVSV